MDFEFDPDKSASNKLKHGIDFMEAQDLWFVHRLCSAATGAGRPAMRGSRGIVTGTCGRLFIPTAERISGSFRFGKRAGATGKSMKKTFPKTEEELTDRFDAGEDLESLGFDVKKAQVEQPKIKRVNVDFPEHMLAMLDREAELRGINRQALIKTWLYERLHAAGK